MKKKTYKALQNRLLRAHKAWLIEKHQRMQAEEQIQDAKNEANRYEWKFRSIGSSVETIDPGPGKIKMLKWTIPAEEWGDYICFDKALIDINSEDKTVKYIKEELAKSISNALLENDIVQYIIKQPSDSDPLSRFGTFGGKLYVVPWEYMANKSKTIELIKKMTE
jgi:hypothetical protein